MKKDKSSVYIKTFGWPLVTVARDGAGDSKEDKWFGIKELWHNWQVSTNLMNIAQCGMMLNREWRKNQGYRINISIGELIVDIRSANVNFGKLNLTS